MTLYRRDAQTGEHLVTHDGQVLAFPTRAAALAAAHTLMSDQHEQGEHGVEAAPPG